MQHSGAMRFVSLATSVNKLQDRDNFGTFSKLWLVEILVLLGTFCDVFGTFQLYFE
jgi:hypothetical protein